MEIRSQHWTDRPHPTKGGERQRTIGTHLHHWNPEHTKGNGKDPGGGDEWTPNEQGIVARDLNVPNWAGPNEFALQSRKGPLEKFFRDASDPGNRSTYGVRRADMPHVWVNFKALDCSDSDAVVSDDGLTVTHPELWPATTVVLTDGNHKLKEDLILDGDRKAEWPIDFKWTMKIAPGCTAEVLGNVLKIRDSDGVVRIETRAPWGEDSATTAPTASGKQDIRCTFTIEGTQFGLPVVRLTPSADDMSNAIGTVTLDPTTAISGTTAIDDTCIRAGLPNSNYGGFYRVYTDKDGDQYGLVRVNDGHYPIGTYTVVTLYIADLAARIGSHSTVQRILPANAGWGEGTQSGGVATLGESNYVYAQYSTQPWAGSSGLKTLETDTTATDQSTNLLTSGAGYNTWSLSPNFFTGWAAGDFANAGIYIKSQILPTLFLASTEDVTYPLYFDVEYATGPSSFPYYFDMISRMRR